MPADWRVAMEYSRLHRARVAEIKDAQFHFSHDARVLPSGDTLDVVRIGARPPPGRLAGHRSMAFRCRRFGIRRCWRTTGMRKPSGRHDVCGCGPTLKVSMTFERFRIITITVLESRLGQEPRQRAHDRGAKPSRGRLVLEIGRIHHGRHCGHDVDSYGSPERFWPKPPAAPEPKASPEDEAAEDLWRLFMGSSCPVSASWRGPCGWQPRFVPR